MKKIKTLLFSTLPMILSISIQNIILIYMLLIVAIGYGIFTAATNAPIDDRTIEALMLNPELMALVSIVFSVTVAIFFGIWYYKTCGGNFRPNIRKTFHPLHFVGIIFLVIGTQFASDIIVTCIANVFPSWWEAYLRLLESAGMDENISIVMMIYSVCLAPISEELIFRGVTMRIARRSFPFWAANLIQAVLFGIFHMNIVQGIYAAFLGLFLGYICEKGGSIYLAIIFHVLFNLWGTTVVNWLNQIQNENILGLMIIAGSVIGLAAGMLIFRQGNQLIKRRNA